MGEPGGDQSEQGLPHLELDQPGFLDHLLHVAGPVEQRQQPPLLRRELGRRLAEVVPVHREDQVEGRDLLLDQAPLVDPPGALEQQVLGVDPDEEILPLRPDAGLEVEGPRGPGEQVVHRLLDLEADVVLQLGPRDQVPCSTRISPSLCSRSPSCGSIACCSCSAVIRPLAQQDVAQAVAAIDDRGEDDVAFVEVDGAEVVLVGEREAPGPPPQEEQLDDVGKARLLEAALDRHQRQSSTHAVADLGPLPDHLLPAARAAGGGCDDAARPVRRRRRLAPGGSARTARRRAPRARGRRRRTLPRLGGIEDPLQLGQQRPHRVRRAGGEIVHQLGVGLAHFAASSRAGDRLANLPVRRGQLDHQPALEPGAQSRLQTPELGERRRGGKDHLPARLEQHVEEQEQLVLGPIVVGDEVHVVQEEGGDPAVACAPDADRVAIDGVDQLASELRRAETGDRAAAAFGEGVAQGVEQVGLARRRSRPR